MFLFFSRENPLRCTTTCSSTILQTAFNVILRIWSKHWSIPCFSIMGSRGFGDPEDPCNKHIQPPPFWRVQWFLGKTKSPTFSPGSQTCIFATGLDTTSQISAIFGTTWRWPTRFFGGTFGMKIEVNNVNNTVMTVHETDWFLGIRIFLAD